MPSTIGFDTLAFVFMCKTCGQFPSWSAWPNPGACVWDTQIVGYYIEVKDPI